MTKTTINIDDDLLDRARKLLRTTGKTDTVNAALREVVEREARQAWLDWWASNPLPDLRDPKVMRQPVEWVVKPSSVD